MDNLTTAEPTHLHQRSLNRKLLQTSNLTPRESDPLKAVVLYKPPSVPLSQPGRSLTGTNPPDDETKHVKVPTKASSKTSLQTCFRNLGILSLLVLLCYSFSSKFENVQKCKSSNVSTTASTFSFTNSLFGQELAKEILLNRVDTFLRSNDSISVLLLVGGPGTGKTFTTSSVYNSLQASIPKRKIVLPLSTNELLSENRVEPQGCSTLRVLFVEDVDSAELWQMQLLIDHLQSLQRLNGNLKTVVFINSSAGQRVLTRILYEKLESNQSRSSVGPEVLQLLPETVHSTFIDLLDRANLNFSFVPFFPLQKVHVRQCIERELKLKKILPTSELVEKILGLIRFHPTDSQYFAVFGCKNVHTYVNLVLSDVNS